MNFRVLQGLKPYQLIVIAGLIGGGCADSSSDESTNPTASTPLTEALAVLTAMPLDVRSVVNEAPDAYDFTSFVADGNSVNYTGQTFRQVLNEDMKTFIGGLTLGAYEGTADELYAALDSYYSYSYDNAATAPGVINGSSTIQVTVKDSNGAALAFLQDGTYDSVQSEGSNLRSKTAGVDNPLRREVLKGWNDAAFSSPEALIENWMRVIAEQAAGDESSFTVENGDESSQLISKAYLTSEGLDYSQLIQKFLHGAVSFSQAARDYLSTDLGDTKGLNADNTEVAAAGKVYTALEHHWDEGFGYFGAARNYLSYTDDELIADIAIDANDDGVIDILSEWNSGLSLNAAKRDAGSADGTVNFTQEIMTSFIHGRHLISKRPEGYMTYLKAYAVKALGEWEKVIAATVIHYINDTISEMDEYGTPDYLFTDHAKYWSEMKGFALAFQFSPVSSLSDEDFDRFHELVADKPVLGAAGSSAMSTYKQQLLEARSILQAAFLFSDSNVEGW